MNKNMCIMQLTPLLQASPQVSWPRPLPRAFSTQADQKYSNDQHFSEVYIAKPEVCNNFSKDFHM